MNFGEALEHLKSHHLITRSGWNEKGVYLKLVSGDENPRTFRSYNVKNIEEVALLSWIGIKSADNKFVPWLASQIDVLAEDWVVVTI
jgi:Protein of unknown function (DUF2829)